MYSTVDEFAAVLAPKLVGLDEAGMRWVIRRELEASDGCLHLVADNVDQPLVFNQDASPAFLKPGDYVFASRWEDCSPGDPWAVGYVSEVREGYVTLITSPRSWRHARCISLEQGKRIVEQYPDLERSRVNFKRIREIWYPTPKD